MFETTAVLRFETTSGRVHGRDQGEGVERGQFEWPKSARKIPDRRMGEIPVRKGGRFELGEWEFRAVVLVL